MTPKVEGLALLPLFAPVAHLEEGDILGLQLGEVPLQGGAELLEGVVSDVEADLVEPGVVDHGLGFFLDEEGPQLLECRGLLGLPEKVDTAVISPARAAKHLTQCLAVLVVSRVEADLRRLHWSWKFRRHFPRDLQAALPVDLDAGQRLSCRCCGPRRSYKPRGDRPRAPWRRLLDLQRAKPRGVWRRAFGSRVQ